VQTAAPAKSGTSAKQGQRAWNYRIRCIRGVKVADGGGSTSTRRIVDCCLPESKCISREQ
jgi:hypothetical protein